MSEKKDGEREHWRVTKVRVNRVTFTGPGRAEAQATVQLEEDDRPRRGKGWHTVETHVDKNGRRTERHRARDPKRG
jgi:hypothetical protein